MLTFVLIILLNYYFTLIGYSFYFDLYDGRCGSMLYCFMETFDKAFKNNGGIGGWMDSTST
jgi:inositol 1,4,5-triphosphate receptor type 1/inositol 1,4,5-triphosphate receptor type 3